MTTFLDLHDARWGTDGSTAFAGRLSRFHHELAADALAGGWLRLYFLELDGRPRAATYCFRLGDADWYYQAGRDPAFDKDRIGNVLLTHAIREAVRGGMSEFKLLLGAHAYKDRLKTHAPLVESVAVSGNSALEATLKAALAIKQGGRSLSRLLRKPR